jgi:protein SCO1/2
VTAAGAIGGVLTRAGRALALAALGAALLAGPALAQGMPRLRSADAVSPNRTPPQLEGLGIVQKIGGAVPRDVVLADEEGRPVAVGDLLGKGRPVVLALVYYECPMLCNQVLNGLLASMRALSFDAGKEFDVVTVSFDERETHELAAKKKKAYLERYERAGADAGWRFLTGKEPAVRALAESVGFDYRFDAATNQFAHGAAVFVLTPDGVVSRYLFGIDYPPRDLRLALVEASEGKIGTVTDQVLLYCYKYDPTTGRYGAAVLNLIRAGGVLTLLLLAAFMIGAARRGGAPGGGGAAGAAGVASALRGGPDGAS